MACSNHACCIACIASDHNDTDEFDIVMDSPFIERNQDTTDLLIINFKIEAVTDFHFVYDSDLNLIDKEIIA